MDYKSKITTIVAKVKGHDFDILVSEVQNGLSEFISAKAKEQGKSLSPEQMEDINAILDRVENATSLPDLDVAILDLEASLSKIIDIKLGELEFAVATHLQAVFREVEEFTKEGKILPFDPKKGLH